VETAAVQAGLGEGSTVFTPVPCGPGPGPSAGGGGHVVSSKGGFSQSLVEAGWSHLVAEKFQECPPRSSLYTRVKFLRVSLAGDGPGGLRKQVILSNGLADVADIHGPSMGQQPPALPGPNSRTGRAGCPTGGGDPRGLQGATRRRRQVCVAMSPGTVSPAPQMGVEFHKRSHMVVVSSWALNLGAHHYSLGEHQHWPKGRRSRLMVPSEPLVGR
jgi:hypothetical protein